MMNKGEMTVIQINTLGATLSTGRTTREMHNYFLNHNIDSHIVGPAPLDCDDAFFFSSKNEMRMDTLMTMLTGLEAHNSKRQTKRLLEYFDIIKPDIVHLRILHSNYINLPMLFRYLSRNDIATVITLHDFWFLTGKCCFYTNLKCDKWITGCYSCTAPQNLRRPVLFERSKRMWRDKMEGLSSIKRLALVGVSDWVANEAKKSQVSNSCIIRRIYNWIDLSTFKPHNVDELREKYSLKNKFVVLGVSAVWKINDRKGLDVYLNVSKEMPEDYVIVLIGNMEYSGILPDNIISVGAINDKKLLSDFYSLADVYLNLSTEETFGKVSAEALSCGTPVVAINATANKELVPSQCGIVVDDSDCGVILSALSNIKVLGKKKYLHDCRKFAEEMFSMDNNIKEYISLYDELLAYEGR